MVSLAHKYNKAIIALLEIRTRYLGHIKCFLIIFFTLSKCCHLYKAYLLIYIISTVET